MPGTNDEAELRRRIDGLQRRVAELEEALHERERSAEEEHGAQAELARREAELRTTLYSIGDAVISTDIEGRVARMNPVAERLTGWSEAEAMGKPLEQVFHIVNEETQCEVENPVARVLREGVVVGLANHTLLIARDGREVPIADAGAPITDDNGELAGVVLVFRDQTEERRFQQTQHQLASIVESSFDAIIGKTLDGTVVSWNAAAERIFGYTAEELVGKSILKIVPPDRAGEVQRWLEKVRRGERLQTLDTVRKRKDGRLINVALTISPIVDDVGKVVGASTVARDQTEHVQAQKALRESEERLRAAGRAAYDLIYEWEVATDALEWFGDIDGLLGYREGEISRDIKAWLDLIHPEDRVKLENAVEVHRTSTEPIQYEYRVQHKDGTYRYWNDHGLPLLDDKGRPYKWVGVCTDVTERRQAEEEHKRLQAQLTQAQKLESVGRLAGGVAHDYNNMLSVILGYAELALGKVDPSEQLHEDLWEIRKAAQRSMEVTRQLMAFARKQTIAPQASDLNDAVGRMLKMLRHLIGEDIDLAWLPEAGLWPVRMDPSQLDQVLANLCVNARDAIAGVGKITIETQNVVLDEDYCAEHAGFVPGEFVLLVVSDDGCGMGQETLDKLFEPFFSTKEMGEGTGLGLATVYGIVKQNNGFIHVYSEPEKGTTFKIYLPRHEGKVVEDRSTGAVPIPRGRGETVLVVEDEVSILKLAERTLDALGYRVLTAETPAQALELAGKHGGEISLLITDVVLPEMNGRGLTERLQSSCPNLKSLYMSGYTANVIARRGVLDEAVNFIQKPFSTEDLAVKVREALASE